MRPTIFWRRFGQNLSATPVAEAAEAVGASESMEEQTTQRVNEENNRRAGAERAGAGRRSPVRNPGKGIRFGKVSKGLLKASRAGGFFTGLLGLVLVDELGSDDVDPNWQAAHQEDPETPAPVSPDPNSEQPAENPVPF
jgi:hypothetical protein